MRPAGRSFRSVFQSPLGSQLRAVTIDGAPWFLAKDACTVLGLLGSDNVRRGLDPSEVKSVKLMGLRGKPPLLVRESGPYKLIMRSTVPGAQPFQDWVTKDVLPGETQTVSKIKNLRLAELLDASEFRSFKLNGLRGRSRLARGRVPVCQGMVSARLAWDIPAGR